ncbi:MAG: ROK family protein [Candidatus Omnitrophica bacterium]|nr:ROK family protein [Candidatus Omnitrophota bacterium]
MKRAIGLDLGGTFIKVGLVQETGEIIKKAQFPTKADEGKKETVIQQMKNAVSSVWEQGINGIGIGTPGVVDNEGVVFEAPNLPGWNNLQLKKIFEERFKVPVVVENDVNSITWGEYLFGAGKGCRTIICLTLGTGVGGGMVIHGKLFRGAKYSAAELGHISIDYKGPRCKCGSIGCVERFVGRDYIIERAVHEIREGKETLIYQLASQKIENITPKIISEAYKKGDKIAGDIWIDVGICLGAMLASLVNAINPDRIVIGGGISHAGEILFETIKKTIKERSFRVLSENVEVVPAELSIDAGIISGAALIFQS